MPAEPTSVDQALLRAAASGDRSAVAKLIEPEVDRVYAVCLRMVGRPEVARDLAQDALVKAIRGLPDFDGKAQIGTWITRIAMNTALSWLRSQKRSDRRLKAVAEGLMDAVLGGSVEPAPAWSVQWEERRATVARAMDRLTPEHRAVLVLRDVRGLEYDQIGAVLDIASGTVKSRLFRARAALRDEVTRLEAEPSPTAPTTGDDTDPAAHRT